MEKAAHHILQSSAKKKLKVQNTELLRQRFCGENSYILLISLPTTRQLRKMWHRQSTTEILKRKENFETVAILKTRSTKTGKCFTVIKNCIQNITIVISE